MASCRGMKPGMGVTRVKASFLRNMVLIYRVKTLREFRVFDVKKERKEEGKRRREKKVRSDPSDVSPLDTEFELDNSDDNNWIQPRNQPEAPRSRNWRTLEWV